MYQFNKKYLLLSLLLSSFCINTMEKVFFTARARPALKKVMETGIPINTKETIDIANIILEAAENTEIPITAKEAIDITCTILEATKKIEPCSNAIGSNAFLIKSNKFFSQLMINGEPLLKAMKRKGFAYKHSYGNGWCQIYLWRNQTFWNQFD